MSEWEWFSMVVKARTRQWLGWNLSEADQLVLYCNKLLTPENRAKLKIKTDFSTDSLAYKALYLSYRLNGETGIDQCLAQFPTLLSHRYAGRREEWIDFTLLHVAIQYGQSDFFHCILKRHPDLLKDTQNQQNHSPLTYAALYCQTEIVRIILNSAHCSLGLVQHKSRMMGSALNHCKPGSDRSILIKNYLAEHAAPKSSTKTTSRSHETTVARPPKPKPAQVLVAPKSVPPRQTGLRQRNVPDGSANTTPHPL